MAASRPETTPPGPLERFFAGVLARRTLIVVIYALLLGPAIVFSLRVKQDNSLDRLMVESDPDYATSTEATQALLTAIGVTPTLLEEASGPEWRGMTLIKRADVGNLHVRGFKGRGPKDHFEHLYLIGEVLRSWVVPRWKREERLVYTLASEQL